MKAIRRINEINAANRETQYGVTVILDYDIEYLTRSLRLAIKAMKRAKAYRGRADVRFIFEEALAAIDKEAGG